MKLIRFGKKGSEKPGIEMDSGVRLDVSSFGEEYDNSFFENKGVLRLEEWLDKNKSGLNEVDSDVRLGPPVANPGKIVCIGLNFKDHAEEAGMDLPKEPVVFTKATSALCGSNDNLIIPRNSHKTDWEVELAFVVGKKAQYIDKNKALEYVAGYCLLNDYSERAYQFELGGQWVKGKSCDSFAPLGPYLVTSDAVENVNDLRMWLKVNGETKQDGNTSNLIFGIEKIITYLSQFMTLNAGDIVSTGTPAGVGLGFNPPQFLKAGDIVEYGIEGLGSTSQLCVPWDYCNE